MKGSTIFSHFLTELGVPFTPGFADSQFRRISFKSLFGMQQLLKSYGIDSQGLRLTDKQAIFSLTPPFIARMSNGLVIVTDSTPSIISYLTQGEMEQIPADKFIQAWDGQVFCAYPSASSCEPDYKAHCLADFMVKFRNVGLIVGAVLLFIYLFVTGGLYSRLSTIFLTLMNLAGLWLTVMLVQKSLNIHTRAADRVCKVLQEGGCDSILETKASKAFGIFGWSEVGLTYFSVSLLCLLIFPQWINYLAVCNLLCLPFSFWSIWYQKFKAKVWCTLCVSVQATLWLLFGGYLWADSFHAIFPLRLEFFILGLTYFTVLMALNKLLPHFRSLDS